MYTFLHIWSLRQFSWEQFRSGRRTGSWQSEGRTSKGRRNVYMGTTQQMTIGLNWNQYHKASFPTVATFQFPTRQSAVGTLAAPSRPELLAARSASARPRRICWRSARPRKPQCCAAACRRSVRSGRASRGSGRAQWSLRGAPGFWRRPPTASTSRHLHAMPRLRPLLLLVRPEASSGIEPGTRCHTRVTGS